MNRLDLIIDALKNSEPNSTGWVHVHEQKHQAALTAARELQQELAKPEQAINPFPSFMRKRIEEAIDAAINPTGMSVHDGKATVYAADLHRMLAVIDLAPPRKEWVGLTDEEIHKIVDACTPDETEQEELNDFARAVHAAELRLKEKNGG